MTGSFEEVFADAGTNTFSDRQSSDCVSVTPTMTTGSFCGQTATLNRLEASNGLFSGARAEAFDQRLQVVEIREVIARALQEQHRDLYARQMLRARIGWLTRRVQWEP